MNAAFLCSCAATCPNQKRSTSPHPPIYCFSPLHGELDLHYLLQIGQGFAIYTSYSYYHPNWACIHPVTYLLYIQNTGITWTFFFNLFSATRRGNSSLDLHSLTLLALILHCTAILISSRADAWMLCRIFLLESPTASISSAIFINLRMRIGLVRKIDQSNIAILVSKFARRATREKAAHQLASCLADYFVALLPSYFKMSVKSIYYSEKYYDEIYEYRYVKSTFVMHATCMLLSCVIILIAVTLTVLVEECLGHRCHQAALVLCYPTPIKYFCSSSHMISDKAGCQDIFQALAWINSLGRGNFTSVQLHKVILLDSYNCLCIIVFSSCDDKA